MSRFRHNQLNEKTPSGRTRILPIDPLIPSILIRSLSTHKNPQACQELQKLFSCYRQLSATDLFCLEIIWDAMRRGSLKLETEFIFTPPRFDESLDNIGGERGRVAESADHQAMKQWVFDHCLVKGLEGLATEVSFLGYRVDVASLQNKTFVECGDTEVKKIFDFLKREQEIGILQYESEEIVWFKPSSGFPEFANARSRGYLP